MSCVLRLALRTDGGAIYRHFKRDTTLARHVAALPVMTVPVLTAGSPLMQLWAESAITPGMALKKTQSRQWLVCRLRPNR